MARVHSCNLVVPFRGAGVGGSSSNAAGRQAGHFGARRKLQLSSDREDHKRNSRRENLLFRHGGWNSAGRRTLHRADHGFSERSDRGCGRSRGLRKQQAGSGCLHHQYSVRDPVGERPGSLHDGLPHDWIDNRGRPTRNGHRLVPRCHDGQDSGHSSVNRFNRNDIGREHNWGRSSKYRSRSGYSGLQWRRNS